MMLSELPLNSGHIPQITPLIELREHLHLEQWMWKQPSGVKLCIRIFLHSEAQKHSTVGTIKETQFDWRGTLSLLSCLSSSVKCSYNVFLYMVAGCRETLHTFKVKVWLLWRRIVLQAASQSFLWSYFYILPGSAARQTTRYISSWVIMK